ncbi:Methionyl-tRNA formyltransferase-like protein [Haloterrigena turkmenica DSM 5511]|uniref:Methionyl-tRNA formyltransferase-like protein n=1 Tax=Haloterrigena turkmenica (strain ATCC 51198 / DSM 5511 / JCM 9101 / NCIMB 13204 / VKM B-1734 / 4k) TaxID=543526 RepID=D2RWZ7_HALTV|nr:formyltransferase family protein [Haloterrigena turkmenica]ADB59609.1 Methionyl-tRNA formyltransferase-like protein [Haloterrigena turkmenica DSM 5511]
MTVGVLAEPSLYEWQVRALERLRREAAVDIEIPLVVHNAAGTAVGDESWDGGKDRLSLADVVELVEVFREERAWTAVLAERSLGRLFGDERPLWHRRATESVDALADADHVRCRPRTEDGWNELPPGIVSRLADRCDVVVRFGFGLLRGDVLTAPEHGVVSFHPANIRRYRGMGPPAIFHDGRDRAGTTLQRLNESIDGGELVAYEETSIADCRTLWDVFDRLAALQIRLLSEGIENLRDPTIESRSISDAELGPFYYRDRRRTLRFSSRVLLRNLAGRLRRRLESA